MVHWTLLGKRLKKPLVKTIKVNLGGLRDYSEERYTVKLDIEFAGSLYKDTKVMLDDRRDREPVLLNRKLMRLMNVMVNPSRKYVVTTKFSLEK